jgi:hypothetical protein
MCPLVAPAKKCKRCCGGQGNLPVGLQRVQNAPYPGRDRALFRTLLGTIPQLRECEFALFRSAGISAR